MIKRCDPYRYDVPCPRSGEDKENLELIDWAWNSHFWIEHYPGYTKCKWCGREHTSGMGIGLDFPLCEENPCIEKFVEKYLKSRVWTCESCGRVWPLSKVVCPSCAFEKEYICPKCSRQGLPSIHGNFCTDCANKERGLSIENKEE